MHTICTTKTVAQTISKEFFRVINWDKVSENYEKALKPHQGLSGTLC